LCTYFFQYICSADSLLLKEPREIYKALPLIHFYQQERWFTMDLSMPTIEHITGQQLRKLTVWPKEISSEEEDFYAENCILDLEDNDELSIEEGGFMIGYLGDLDK